MEVESYVIRIPEGGNSIFKALEAEEGKPVKTERLHLGLSGVRIDYFACGCMRTYTARMTGGIPEAEEDVEPCPRHQHLKALAGTFTSKPKKPEQQKLPGF